MPTLQRVVRLSLLAFASVLALTVAGYLVVNLVAVAGAAGKRHTLEDQITQRLGEELPGSAQRADSLAERIGTEPILSWSAQHCGFETDDAGWIVQGYREVCSLESVRAWPVDSADEALAVLGGVVPVGAAPYDYGACHSYVGSVDEEGSQVSLLYIEPSAEDERYCEPTDRTSAQRHSVIGDPPELDKDQGWVVVVDSTGLVDEEVGCTHWSVIFCDNPFGDRPAWGEPPS